MKWESRDTESATLQPWPAHENGSKLPTDFEDYAHLRDKCPRKITHCDDKPFTERQKSKSATKKRKVLLDISISEKQERLCFLTVRSLGCDAQSCLSVSVLNCCLVLLPPQMSLGMCKGGCKFVFIGGVTSPSFQISIWEI